ncbi:hypothetical protein C1645_811834 [Glomus cerebriforme]|uniref:Uncharacterized protein n=1 Tax=Glomus cerebriforme TaxID=658196 RepID=A0A397TM99_9GLOM|nr:hypothetical protein C1645_811834 [Glomus cerebriforme]
MNKIDEQLARILVYSEIKSLLSDITNVNLRKITSRAKKVYVLFEGIGIDKIQATYKSSTDDTDECQKMISMTNHHTHVTESSEVSVLTYVSNSSDLINSPVILYNARTPYINVALKEYPYLSLYNSDRHNDAYEFKNSGLCPGCEKEHNKGNVVSRCIKDSYYIKYQSLPNEKKIKINVLPEMILSITPQASYDDEEIEDDLTVFGSMIRNIRQLSI